ncbi:hypothetical protein B2J88_36295 [Rhodococcus sp. SRB_17]|uniref:hypothetical protein n=1 Tax=Acidovorax sp. SRB_24 TaxID=1962700 RepID=UPI00145F7013|nr:hypothetical protein [Acidovorax sp. SRB_24]NMM77917.1 hypothetical protein [Acidovorax sp. SRB_24]NMM89737.1 hypothetical protein [Rhodococcus sp. SRB_17]
MKLTKVAFAIASVLAVAAGSANAGQIDSSSATLATEVIYSNAQVVRAPSKSYSFAGDVDARTNEQRLQMQYTLAKGTWAVGAGQLFTAVNTAVDVSAAALLKVVYLDGANANQVALPAGSIVSAFLTADAKTVVFNVTVPVGATNLMKTPIFTINSLGVLGTSNVGVSNLFDVAGATACVAPDAALNISFKHFSNHTGGVNVLTEASPDSEHLRAGSTNEARLLNFTQNLKFDFTPSAKPGQTDANFVNMRLAGTNWVGQNQVGVTPAAAIVPPAAAVAPASQYYMGFVKLTQRGTGLDTDYAHVYGDSVTPFKPADPFIAADFSPVTTAAANVGAVEYTKFAVTLTLPAAWPAGTVILPVDKAGVALADVTATLNPARTQVTIAATSADGATALANGAYVFAKFDGLSAIPQTSSVVAEAAITKAPAGAAFFAEQNNVCAGSFTGIGGGIKIDVRNYAAYATFGASGPATTVRIINNSETNAADVYGQMIYADGTYGAWGKLADLKPREVVNMANKDVEAKLTNAAAATNPFGAGAVGYEAKGGTAVVGGSKAGISDRLRIVSNTGSTLRVQSYMVVGSTVIDTSNAQGVDFENTRDAVPAGMNDAQPISQDAINGLGK